MPDMYTAIPCTGSTVDQTVSTIHVQLGATKHLTRPLTCPPSVITTWTFCGGLNGQTVLGEWRGITLVFPGSEFEPLPGTLWPILDHAFYPSKNSSLTMWHSTRALQVLDP